MADQFGGDWERYLARLETATPPIRVLGIADYLCVRTYSKVVAHKKAGRLRNVEMIFPNVEMRLDTKTSQGRAINLHLLFSPEDPEHEQHIERVLSQLTFDYRETQYPCSRSGIINLGRKFDPRQTDDDGAFATGVNQFKVTLGQLRSLFKNDTWVRDNCLVAVASSNGDGTSGLQDDGAFAATRQEIERFAHIIFSGNAGDREFWLGLKGKYPKEWIERNYNSLKPCLQGCDAHRIEDVGAPPLNRYCWIKGDFHFETLRQAVIEPEERVRIDDRSPASVTDSVTIASVRPINMPWLENHVIPLNRGLVCIIGARGLGKTALVDVIAAGANALGPTLGDACATRY